MRSEGTSISVSFHANNCLNDQVNYDISLFALIVTKRK